MDLDIVKAAPATPEAWDRLWESCEYATYFHSREWAEVWREHTRGRMRPRPRWIHFSDGRQALLPLSAERAGKGLFRLYHSSPAGTFGGWLAADSLGPAHGELLVNYMRSKLPNLVWRLNPYEPLARQCLGRGGEAQEADETHALPLSGGFEALRQRWAAGGAALLRKVRKAEKQGVAVRRAEGLQDWQDYYEVYERSLGRWGDRARARYSFPLFETLRKRRSRHIQLWLAAHQDRVVAGALCLYSRKHAVYWHGAALEEGFPLRAVNLLLHEAIREACARGCSWFDFNPSGGLEGVKAFKRSFGAEPLPCPLVRRRSGLASLLGKVKRLAGQA